jgi:hypothetical protein
MLAYGGPATAPHGGAELGLGVGAAAALFEGGHSGGQGWFTRWRHGLGESTDLGIDLAGFKYSDKGTLTGKLALRNRVGRHWRFESGLGAADDSQGKSVSAELGITWGTVTPHTWNYYASFRAAGVLGLNLDDAEPPDALFVGATVGTQATILANQHFIFEGGGGLIAPRAADVGGALIVSAGLQFRVGGHEQEPLSR